MSRESRAKGSYTFTEELKRAFILNELKTSSFLGRAKRTLFLYMNAEIPKEELGRVLFLNELKADELNGLPFHWRELKDVYSQKRAESIDELKESLFQRRINESFPRRSKEGFSKETN